MSDGDLVRQTLDGRPCAYEELVRRWAARVLAFCHAKTGSSQVAEDLAQESLLRGYRGLRTLQEPEKFGGWLRGIALRVCLDWLKSKQSQQVTFGALTNGNPDEMFVDPACGPDQAADSADQVRQLLLEVENLPEEYREVVMLYYYQDATYRDLAELLGVSTATINARLTKARALLRERMSSSRRQSV
jgi:RNA polymerase sigma-70 factor (ECF subfamily)